MNIIEIKELNKIYNKDKSSAVHALRGVDLAVEEGEVLAIMGVSGSGKSTLLHIIGCLDSPTSGTCLIGGTDISTLSRVEMADMRNNRIGFVLQEYGLLLKESVFDNIRLPLMFGEKFAYRDIKKRVNEVAESLGIDKLLKKKVRELSGGQKQRVAIARALVNDPDIILADEPTGALDSSTADEIMEVLLNINKEGKTLMVVTHDIKVADKLGRTVRIADGLIVSDTNDEKSKVIEA